MELPIITGYWGPQVTVFYGNKEFVIFYNYPIINGLRSEELYYEKAQQIRAIVDIIIAYSPKEIKISE